jgi:predicted RNase H-like HicB family nuclease
MQRRFTLEYWVDDDWYVGKLQEVPGVFSQGETLDELEENIRDAYRIMLAEERTELHPEAKTKDIVVDVG